ncbi:Putative gustatory receptor 28b [Camponotus floridanus]|uniref:Gustatory receptor n=1 Tax=Camponotus floridanus TaxID=104421 RepID=E2A9G3_CAMFO|nr:Putative gustatory receptor 28b [Camponotus floridanus]
MACLISALIWCFWRDLRRGWENSTRLTSRNAIIFTASDGLGIMSLMIVSVIGSIMHWQQVQTIIDKLIDCDEKLGIISQKKLRWHTILLTFCSLSYCIIVSCLDVCSWNYRLKLNKKLDNKGPFNYLPLYFMYITIIMMEIQYAIIVYNVGQRFFRINKTLENILNSSKITNQFRKDLGLVSAVNLPSSCMHRFCLVSAGNLTSNLTDSGWFLPPFINRQKLNADTDNYGSVSAVNLPSSCMHRFCLDSAGNLTSNLTDSGCFLPPFINRQKLNADTDNYGSGAKKTAVLVSQLLSVDHDREGIKQLEIFSLQLLHRPLEFSACGLFTLDRTLVTSIAGAVTTYLVILIQFQKDDDTKGSFDNILKNATQILRNATTLHNITAGRWGP